MDSRSIIAYATLLKWLEDSRYENDPSPDRTAVERAYRTGWNDAVDTAVARIRRVLS